MPTIIVRRDRDRRMRGFAIPRGICIEEAYRGGEEEWDQEGLEKGLRSWERERESRRSSSCSKRHRNEHGRGVEQDKNREKSRDRELR